MLCDGAARRRDDNCRSCGGVETGPAKSACATRIERIAGQVDCAGIPAHDFRAREKFLARFAAYGEPHQERADLLGRDVTGQDGCEGDFKLTRAEGIARREGFEGGGEGGHSSSLITLLVYA